MYHDKALETLKKVAANSGKAKKALVWTSSLTRRDDALVNLPKENYTIQIWSFHDDPSIAETVNKVCGQRRGLSDVLNAAVITGLRRYLQQRGLFVLGLRAGQLG